MQNKIKCLAILGPTASGKTGLAIDLARKYNGEVISIDSRQVYRKLNIGTSKVTKEEADGIPHHLIDVIDIGKVYTAERFKTDAENTIWAIDSRHHTPILAGGTFFYFDVLRGRISMAPVSPIPQLREKLETLSTDELGSLVESRDPTFYQKIDRQNRRRLIRAVEIFDTLGYIPNEESNDGQFEFFTIGLYRPKEELRDRYKLRAEEWLENGFQTEVEELLQAGASRSRLQEIGFEYRLMLSYIDGQITSQEEFIEKFVQKNWQYAKRQYTWLRRDETVHWHHPNDIKEIYADTDHFLAK